MALKVALVVGNTDYADTGLSRLQTPTNDVVNLAKVLKHADAGGFDDVKTLINPTSSDARREIAKLFAQRSHDDLVVLYFSGHGVLDEHGELHLAVRDTEREIVDATGVPAKFISEQMDRSTSKRAVLILDCCHSGAFARGSKGAVGGSVGTKTAFEGNGQGRVVLTATDATQYAFEGDQVTGDGCSSVFTKHLLAGISTGEADVDGDGFITIDELYDYVQARVLAESPRQSPLKWTMGQKGAMVIAKNPSPRPADLPADIQEMMRATQTSAREAAVRDLGKLLEAADLRVALAAKLALETMQLDDSRRVSDAAKAALATSKVEARKPIVEIKTGPAAVPVGAGASPPAYACTAGRLRRGRRRRRVRRRGRGSRRSSRAPYGPQQQGQYGPAAPPAYQGHQYAVPPAGHASAYSPPETWVLVLLSIFVTPLAVYLKFGKATTPFWWTLVPWGIGWFLNFSFDPSGPAFVLAAIIVSLVNVCRQQRRLRGPENAEGPWTPID